MAGSARSRPLDDDFRYRHPIEVRYGDTDALGHVNNAVYLSYFEAARAGYYRELTGHPFGSGPDTAAGTFVIAEAHITYRQPARFGEPLWCSCRVAWLGRSAFGLEYRIDAEATAIGEARLIADGSTVQVFYDLGSGSVTRIPAATAARIGELEGRAIPRRPSPSLAGGVPPADG